MRQKPISIIAVLICLCCIFVSSAFAENASYVNNYPAWRMDQDKVVYRATITNPTAAQSGANVQLTCNPAISYGTLVSASAKVPVRVYIQWQNKQAGGSWVNYGSAESYTASVSATGVQGMPTSTINVPSVQYKNNQFRAYVQFNVSSPYDFVQSAYLAVHGRTVDTPGLKTWSDMIEASNLAKREGEIIRETAPGAITPANNVSAMFVAAVIGTTEYYERVAGGLQSQPHDGYPLWGFNNSDGVKKQIIEDVYEFMLGRTASEKEKNEWLGQMNGVIGNTAWSYIKVMGTTNSGQVYEIHYPSAITFVANAISQSQECKNYMSSRYGAAATRNDGRGYWFWPRSWEYTGNISMYTASVSIPSFNLTYNANGGSGTVPSGGNYGYGEKTITAGNALWKTGYHQDGWKTAAGRYYGAVEYYYIPWGDTTFYAQWAANTYIVAYNANGGSGWMGNQTLTYDVAANLAGNAFTRTGHSFVGWNTAANGTGATYANGQSVKNLTATNNGTVTLYAQWKPYTYTVSYDANGGANAPAGQTKTYGVPLTLTESTPTLEGYGFTGWNTAADGSGTAYAPAGDFNVEADTVLYAQWLPSTHLVTYDANGGENAPEAQIKYASTPLTLTDEVPARDEYRFMGWSATADGTGAAYASGDSYNVDEDITLYAQWKIRNALGAEVANLTVGSERKDSNQFVKGEYGKVIITLKGEISKIEISYPEELRAVAEAEDLLEPITLTIGSGLEADGASGFAEFYVPINFNVDLTTQVTVTATYADGEVITQTPTLVTIHLPGDLGWFHTRLL